MILLISHTHHKQKPHRNDEDNEEVDSNGEDD